MVNHHHHSASEGKKGADRLTDAGLLYVDAALVGGFGGLKVTGREGFGALVESLLRCDLLRIHR